ncbi:F-box/WD repeat-containing protein 12 [Astyanax mexicanus]|uniref:F-box/WD repeat-containing protein 12 n=1 Tax=Astyanax mexicanus TaxID=7994 RepID=A0A8T2LDM4_ASTMX|nr:F-box/WD repeat-containing protein 12 [Astyanax mexicanus]
MEECVYPSLHLDCLISIFSFLSEDDLVTVSYVCKEWYEAAETPWLWRELCLHHWGFCNLGQLLCDSEQHTWKRYFLRRSKLEQNMKSGRTGGDYTCKSLRGHKGRLVGFSYLVENSSVQDSWNCSPVVCSASSDGTVKAWDIHKAVNLWTTTGQNPLTAMFTDPQRCLVGASDNTGTIKLWNGETGEEIASYSGGSSQCTLMPFNKDENAFLMVTLIKYTVFLKKAKKNVRNSLGGALGDVLWSESVCSPVAGEKVVSMNLPVCGCSAAVFLPSQRSRLAVIHTDGLHNQRTVTVFDLSLKKSLYKEEPQAQQVESFKLELNQWHSDLILKAKGSNTLLLTDGNDLKVYTLKGALIATFKDHTQPIISLCVDNFRVVTASRDLSLRVLTWRNDREAGLTLESQYHLLGGSHSMSRGFSQVECDYASIVASVEAVDGKDVLKAYIFNS